jgi:Protein of unknown function (DUF3489)
VWQSSEPSDYTVDRRASRARRTTSAIRWQISLACFGSLSDECVDRKQHAAKEKPMSTIDSENNSKPVSEAAQPKVGRKLAKKTKPAKKAGRGKAPAKAKAERTNKKAEIIAMMRRVKGVTLAEIMAATDWQAHTVRGFVSILGSKGGEKIESSKNAAGERTYCITK